MSMLPPTPPPRCPECHAPDVRFVRQYDNYPKKDGTDHPPTSTVFTYDCRCGCSFAVTVEFEPYEERLSS